MTIQAFYPIGTPGRPWGEAEVAAWRSRQTVRRSYAADVLSAIETLRTRFDVSEYGHLRLSPPAATRCSRSGAAAGATNFPSRW